MDRFFIRRKFPLPPPGHSDLPDPEESTNPELTTAVNASIIERRDGEPSAKRKRGSYSMASEDFKLKVVKCALQCNNVRSAIKKFSTEENVLKENTVREWVKKYKTQL
ncbi:MAG: helix-turn-helix domain-containing protein, partial [Gammaproteobacteria bacterium]|nr:helix-turn-helix domain-containing protein [Gammaproteobacteria bacterium]